MRMALHVSELLGCLERGLSCYSGSNAFLHFVLCSDSCMKPGLLWGGVFLFQQ